MKSLGKGSISLTVHTKLIAVIFFAEKLLGAFAVQCRDFAYNMLENLTFC